MMKTKIRVFLSLFFIVLVGFYLFVETNLSKSINDLSSINKIQEIKLQNLKLDNLIEKLNSNSYSNFDVLTDILQEITSSFDGLESFGVLSDDEVYNFKKQFVQKKDLILLLKIKSATIKNSLSFIPTITKKIVSSKDVDQELLQIINQIFRDILYFSQTKDENLKNDFQDSVKKLSLYTQTKQNKNLKLLTMHTMLVSRELFSFNKLTNDVLSITLDVSLDEMIYRLDKEHIKKIKQNRIYEFMMFVSIIILSILFYVYYQRDEKSKEKLLNQAKTDRLTGALNRFAFNNISITEQQSYFIVFDIDDFKHINEIYGFVSCDEMLRYFYGVIKKSFQKDIYRIDADKFIIYSYLTLEDIKNEIDIIEKEIKQNDILDFDFTSLIYPITDAKDSDILGNLEAGIYSVRRKDDKKQNIFDINDSYVKEYKGYSHEIVSKKNELLEIINENRIVPFFQPILDVKSGKIYKYEVLSRIKSKDDKYLPPYEYVLLAEKFGLMRFFTLQMIENTFLKVKDEKNKEFSINLSGYDLENEETLKSILELVKRYEINPSSITFEITETAVISNIKDSIESIKILKIYGFKIAIDDFGVGQSSLQYLKEIPADFIKLDGVFIKNIHNSVTDREFVEVIDKIIKMYGKKSVAEFVENEEILNVLKSINIDYAQGYFIGKPQISL